MARTQWIWVSALCLWGCSNDANSGTTLAPTSSAGTSAAAGVGAPAGTAAPPVSTGTSGTGAAGSGATSGAAGRSAAGTGAAGSAAAGTGAGTGAGGASGGASGASASGAGGSLAAGSGGAAAGAGGAAGGGEETAVRPPCLKKASEVIFIGDSYINYDVAHTLLSTLIEQRAVKDNALTSGQHYRNYAVPGTALAAPNLLGNIPPQWDQAVAADPDIKFVIMDGGGNDVLLDHMECLAAGSDKDAGCQMVVADTLRAGNQLISKMKSGGVHDVIYFFYPHVPAGGDDINDYSLKMLQSTAMALAGPMFRTYVLDLIPIFDGHADWIASDGIHANDSGENVLADEIWKIMKTNCIAQPESSGCCVP